MRLPDRFPFDQTVGLLVDGYEFIPNRRRRARSDVFETMLLLQPAISISGRDATRLFYDEQRFQRTGAMPARSRRR
jgi:fatty-acid peroxygenase